MGEFDFRDLRTVEQLSEANPAACPPARIRWWIEQADANGFHACLVRVEGTEPATCQRCGTPLRPTETWFRVQRGAPPEPLRICTSCAMAKTPGKVQL